MKKKTFISAVPKVVAWLALAALLVWLGKVRAEITRDSGGLKISLPPETGVFKAGPGSELANGQCLTCHSVEYVTTQPLMQRAFWAAAIKKMREKFGANIPEEQVDPLVNYLVTNYGIETNTSAAATVVVKPAEPLTEEAMATRFGCLSCHNVKVKIVGPPLKDVAAKYHNDPKAIDRIMQQIHDGGSGKWGSAVMPPFPMLSEAESRKLAEWVMRQGDVK